MKTDRKIILQEIFSNFQAMTQWLDEPDNYAKYANKAEALIEILEVEDCGSVGGYDQENQNKLVSGYTLYDRFLTLIRKENTRLQKECYFTPKTMTSFFKQLINLREKFNK